jgi:predicted ester cyclase
MTMITRALKPLPGVRWATLAANARPALADYDGDGKVDLGTYTPAMKLWRGATPAPGGVWTIVKSRANALDTQTWGGALGDVAVPADYDGDGAADLAVWNPSSAVWNPSSGIWSIRQANGAPRSSGASTATSPSRAERALEAQRALAFGRGSVLGSHQRAARPGLTVTEGGPMADARKIATEFVDAFNAHDEERIRALNAENAVMEAPGDVRLEGKEATTAYAMSWLNAFPDARITVHNDIVEGDWVAQRFTFEGTHDGTLQSPAGEIPATNRRLTGRGTQLMRVEGDAVAETQLYFDQVQVMTQLGLMPEPAEAARA